MDVLWRYHGLSMDCSWTTKDCPWHLQGLSMHHHGSSMIVHGLPWTMHRTIMDCLSTVHGLSMDYHKLFMDRPWTHRGPPWIRGLSMEPPWTTTDYHELFMGHHRLPIGHYTPSWIAHGTTMHRHRLSKESPRTFDAGTMDRPWTMFMDHHGLSLKFLYTAS